MRSRIRTSPGDVYNAEALEKSVEEMTIEAARQGYAFALVRPRADRDYQARRVNLIYTIDDGQRVYIEQINVRGNMRTRDDVIRREFDVAEGDPYNRALINRAERRLRDLGHFKEVKIFDRSRLVAGPRHHQCAGRRAVDRRILRRRRLLDGGRLPGGSQHRRAQLPRLRPVRQGLGTVRPEFVGLLCRSSSPICSDIASRSASISSRGCRRRRTSCRTNCVRPAAGSVRLHAARGSVAAAAVLDLQPEDRASAAPAQL